MNSDPNHLINGHLDCSLSNDEQLALNEWIKSDYKNADRFVAAAMLHNRIHVHYQSLQATLDHLDRFRVVTAPSLRRSRRLTIVASIACLLLAALLYIAVPRGSNPTSTAVAEFHDLVLHARRPGDRTYRVTIVRDTSEIDDDIPLKVKQLKDAGGDRHAMLYVRDGRQFVFTYKSTDGRQSFIGSNGKTSWTYRVGEKVLEDSDPMQYTGGLPGGDGGKYLAPIVSFFDGQEKLIIADYNLEVHHPSKTEHVFLAGKKPDTKQGPRRIEIIFNQASGLISTMRIWPEVLDHHKKKDFELIELANQDPLDAEWFTPGYHLRQVQLRSGAATGAAD